MKFSPSNYLKSLFLVALVTLIGELVKPYLEPANLVMFYLMVVVISAVRWGRGPLHERLLLSLLWTSVIAAGFRFGRKIRKN